MRERLAGLAHILRQQPYEAAIALSALSGILELGRTAGSAVATLYPHWSLYYIGAALFGGGLLTITGLFAAGYAATDVGRVMARRVEQFGQYLLGGVLFALGSAALTFGLRGVIAGAVDLAIGAAAVGRAVIISRAVVRAGREETDLE